MFSTLTNTLNAIMHWSNMLTEVYETGLGDAAGATAAAAGG